MGIIVCWFSFHRHKFTQILFFLYVSPLVDLYILVCYDYVRKRKKKKKRKHTINRYIVNDVPDVLDDVRNGDREGELRRRVMREAQRKWGAGGKTREIAKSKEYIETVWGPCVGERGTLILLAAGSQTENGPMECGPDRSKLNSQSTFVY